MASIRLFEPADVEWLEPMLDERWAGRMQARRGELVDALAQLGLVAIEGGEPAGVLFWRPDGDETELVLLWAFEQKRGIGQLMADDLRRRVDGPIWAVTTNDNTNAIGFYEHMGFRVREVRQGAVDEARRTLKPAIPEVGAGGTPITDEVEVVHDG